MSIELFKFLFIENTVIKTLLIEDHSPYNEGVLQNLGMEMIHMKLRKTMAGVALSLGLLLPVSGQALATNDLTNADVSTKATSIVDCSKTPFKKKIIDYVCFQIMAFLQIVSTNLVLHFILKANLEIMHFMKVKIKVNKTTGALSPSY